MSEAVRAFSESVTDPDLVIETVARSVSEALGDTCMISLVRGDHLELAALNDPDPAAHAMLVAEMPRRYGLDESPLFVEATKATVFAPALGAGTPRARNATLYAKLGVRGVIAVALRVRGERLGVLMVARHRAGAPAYDDFDRELVEHLAMHAALAVSNSALVQVASEEREARKLLDDALAERKRAVEALDAANRELEAFSYSVAHDLRAPLRAIDGFSQALIEDYADKLDGDARRYLERVRVASQTMAELIDALLALSRVTRAELQRRIVDVSALAREIAVDLERESHRDLVIADGLTADADPKLLAIVLQNLLGNAWKFTAKQPAARIEVGRDADGFFVRDNGAGFDMQRASKLFGVFQRLHLDTEFPGTGIGLATVRRIVERHGGRVWARGAVGMGATFWFTLERSR
jgi:signal transduction histidine kinase